MSFFIVGMVFVASLVLNIVLIRYSHTLKLIDKPNHRSLHKVEKSRSGGVAIFISFMLGILLLGIEISPCLLVAFMVIFALGIYDDIKEISFRVKFFWIIVATTILYAGGYYIDSIGVFAGVDLAMPSFVAYLFLLFAVVGFVNAMNLIDGIDGLSAGIGIVILASFAYVGFKYNDSFLLYTPLVLIASLVGFLLLNWHPSRVFMGDTGSLSLGFVIAVLSIYAINMDYVSAVTILLLAAVPVLDTLIVMVRRVRQKRSPFSPDRTHIHHIVLASQRGDVRKTSSILILLQLNFVYVGLGFKARDDIYTLGVFVMLFVLFYMFLTPKSIKKETDL